MHAIIKAHPMHLQNKLNIEKVTTYNKYYQNKYLIKINL